MDPLIVQKHLLPWVSSWDHSDRELDAALQVARAMVAARTPDHGDVCARIYQHYVHTTQVRASQAARIEQLAMTCLMVAALSPQPGANATQTLLMRFYAVNGAPGDTRPIHDDEWNAACTLIAFSGTGGSAHGLLTHMVPEATWRHDPVRRQMLVAAMESSGSPDVDPFFQQVTGRARDAGQSAPGSASEHRGSDEALDLYRELSGRLVLAGVGAAEDWWAVQSHIMELMGWVGSVTRTELLEAMLREGGCAAVVSHETSDPSEGRAAQIAGDWLRGINGESRTGRRMVRADGWLVDTTHDWIYVDVYPQAWEQLLDWVRADDTRVPGFPEPGSARRQSWDPGLMARLRASSTQGPTNHMGADVESASTVRERLRQNPVLVTVALASVLIVIAALVGFFVTGESVTLRSFLGPTMVGLGSLLLRCVNRPFPVVTPWLPLAVLAAYVAVTGTGSDLGRVLVFLAFIPVAYLWLWMDRRRRRS